VKYKIKAQQVGEIAQQVGEIAKQQFGD